jgi:hypothetical protein
MRPAEAPGFPRHLMHVAIKNAEVPDVITLGYWVNLPNPLRQVRAPASYLKQSRALPANHAQGNGHPDNDSSST